VKNARRTTVDGISFMSRREASRYLELKFLEKIGRVRRLELQKAYELAVEGKTIGHYIADFVYLDSGNMVVEDCKGFRTDLYRWKKKHFEAQYKLKILET